MNPFDRDLSDALKRQDPPSGFAERVMARTSERHERPRFFSMWRWAAAVAAVLVLMSGIFIYRERVRQLEGEKAKEEMMYALRLTGSKLRDIKVHLEN